MQLAGEEANPSESQAATHTAMRTDAPPAGATEALRQIMAQAHATRQRIYQLRQNLAQGKCLGVGGRPLKRVVNLGIGGSHLGAAMVCRALPRHDELSVEFVNTLSPSNDKDKERLAESLFILSSKSFSTEEPLLIAESIVQVYAGDDVNARKEFIAKNFCAITAAPDKAAAFGISDENIFPIDKSIGGRFSLWSAIGMPIIFHCGEEAYEDLLKGAAAMDKHTQDAPVAENMPLLLALLSYWYINFHQTSSICINVYEDCLAEFPAFLQQLVMESCGKQARLGGGKHIGDLSAKSEVLWGGVGTAVQHSYMQLCHQGNQLIPIDFIVGALPPAGGKSSAQDLAQQNSLIAHCLAQSQALLQGRSVSHASAVAESKGLAAGFAPHLQMPGNRPSNSILYKQLTPQILGALIALYENKTVLFAYLSDINPFDQWGVELGKELSATIKEQIKESTSGDAVDPSTALLLEQTRKLRS